MNIKEIFGGGDSLPKKTQVIQSVSVDWNAHAVGIERIGRFFEPSFKVTKDNAETLRFLLMYFTGDNRLISEFKLTDPFNKGVMLVGGVGNGKSLLFKIFRYYTREILLVNSFKEFTAIDVIDSVNVNGVQYLDVFSHNMVDGIARPITCYIDDIGSKGETVNHYGTNLNAIEQLLSLRYNVFSRYQSITHVTSNKYPSEMGGLYDDRIIDRMKEMFNVVELKGSSFRK